MRYLITFIFSIIFIFNIDCTNPTDSQRTSIYKILISRDNLYIRNIDGSEEINLSPNLKYTFHGRFTPDGTKVGFFSSDSIVISTIKLYVVDTNGNNIKFLSENPEPYGNHFSISNSDIIYPQRIGDRLQIYKVDFETMTEINLSNNSYSDGGAIYSPDGSRIAFGRYSNGTRSLCLMNNDGSNKTIIYTFSEPPSDGLAKMVFTPDGMRLVFYFDGEIFQINVDGSNLKQITESERFIDTMNLSMSPLGDKVIYNEWDPENFVAYTYIHNIYTKQRIELFNLSGPSWDYIFTPNWRDVLFTSNDGVFIVDVDGNFVRQLSYNEHASDIYEYK